MVVSQAALERRVDPMLDNAAVTYTEMCERYRQEGDSLTIAQMRQHWMNLQPSGEDSNHSTAFNAHGTGVCKNHATCLGTYREAEASANIVGLEDFLAKQGASHYAEKINAWCLANGAGFLAEIVENWEDVLDHLSLSADERKQFSDLREVVDAETCANSDEAYADSQSHNDQDEAATERIRIWLQKSKAELPKSLGGTRMLPGGQSQTEPRTALTVGHLTAIKETESTTFCQTTL